MEPYPGSRRYFVTRPKKNARFDIIEKRRVKRAQKQGEGFKILTDAEVRLGTQGKTRLAVPLRRIGVKREDGTCLEVITNDCQRSAIEIAALYKARWQACPRAGGDRVVIPLAQAASQAHPLSWPI